MDEKESNIIIATDEEKDVLSQLKVKIMSFSYLRPWSYLLIKYFIRIFRKSLKLNDHPGE